MMIDLQSTSTIAKTKLKNTGLQLKMRILGLCNSLLTFSYTIIGKRQKLVSWFEICKPRIPESVLDFE